MSHLEWSCCVHLCCCFVQVPAGNQQPNHQSVHNQVAGNLTAEKIKTKLERAVVGLMFIVASPETMEEAVLRIQVINDNNRCVRACVRALCAVVVAR